MFHFFMLRHLMTSQHLNNWKFKTWLSEEQKELLVLKTEEILKWKKTYFVSQVLSFRKMKEPSKKVENTIFKHEIVALEYLYDKPETIYVLNQKRLTFLKFPLTLFRMGFFGAAHGWERGWAFCPKPTTQILQWWNLAQLYLT